MDALIATTIFYAFSVLMVTLLVYGWTPHDVYLTEWEDGWAAIKVGIIWPIWLIIAIALIMFRKLKERKCLKNCSTRRF